MYIVISTIRNNRVRRKKGSMEIHIIQGLIGNRFVTFRLDSKIDFFFRFEATKLCRLIRGN